MALVVKDRVKETTTTTGTGTITLAGASTGFQSFSAIGNGNTTYYTIAGQTVAEWEVGIGTYTSSGTTLSRTTILASSNSGSAVNFSAGTKDVFVTYPADYSAFTTNTVSSLSGGTTGLTPSSATTGDVTLGGTLAVANGGTGVTTSTGSGANVLGTSPTISGAVLSSMASSVITSGTAVASTSGTSINFTGIPSWVKRVTIMFSGVSTNGASTIIVQLGDSGGIENTGYSASVAIISSTNNITRLSKYTTYFGINWTEDATYLNYGNIVFTNVSGNLWTGTGLFYQDQGGALAHIIMASGSKSLSATLDRVRISTAGGTATFDAGTINILYE